MLYYTEICIKYKTEKTKKEQFNNYCLHLLMKHKIFIVKCIYVL